MVDRYCVGMQAYSALDYSAYKENKLVNQPTHRYTRRRLHMCCGYPNYLDEDGYKKANPETYFRLVEQLINSMIQQVSIEDAHRDTILPRRSQWPRRRSPRPSRYWTRSFH